MINEQIISNYDDTLRSVKNNIDQSGKDWKKFHQNLLRMKTIFQEKIQNSNSNMKTTHIKNKKKIHTINNIANTAENPKLQKISYNQMVIMGSSITYFDCRHNRNKNGSINELRENIIGAILNEKIPLGYYKISNGQYCEQWIKLRNGLENFVKKKLLNGKTDIKKMVLTHRGGRLYNYDFSLQINHNLKFNIEFKFNVNSLKNTPQFVSPQRPSQYLSSNYSEFYYDHYMGKLCHFAHVECPKKDVFLREIHHISPDCMAKLKQLYYEGCSTSSKYTGNKFAKQFYKYANKLDNESRSKFIEANELDLAKLSSYLMESQKNKTYMLFHNYTFYKENMNFDDYLLISCKKEPAKYRFIVTSKSGKTIHILLRWKNGNGIAFPALQISCRNPSKITT